MLAVGAAAVGSRFGPGATRLLEREHELEAIDRAIAAVSAEGSGLVLLVEGPAGIGKSRLVAEARGRAVESGLTALYARAGEREQAFPFGIVRQLYEPRLADDGVRERVVVGAATAAAGVFATAEEGDASGDGGFASLHGLYWLTANLVAEAPLLLAVDDLHWC